MRFKLLAGTAAILLSATGAAQTTQLQLKEGESYVWTPEPGAPPITISRPAPPPPKDPGPPENAAAATIPDALLASIRAGTTIEQYIASTIAPIRQADRDQDGLDHADIERLQIIARARDRANGIGQVLRYDLDGDFTVTRTELAQSANGDPEQLSPMLASLLKRYDSDGDGRITLEEAANSALRNRDTDTSLENLLALDPDGDGRLTATELRFVAQNAFAIVDSDGDGVISKEEDAAIAKWRNLAQWLRSQSACMLPRAPQDASVVMFGSYESDAISSAVIGGQDQETDLMDVVIEPGTQPLYLVLTSYKSMVWRLSGATGRVVQAVVHSFSGTEPAAKGAQRIVAEYTRGRDRADKISASGVIGLPAARVAIADSDCWQYFSNPEADQARRSIALIERGIGHKIDAAFGSYSAQQVALPSGRLTHAVVGTVPVPVGFDARMWLEASQYWEAGLVNVDPAKIVARAPVDHYLVLPSQMGLSQLLGSGAVERGTGGWFRIVRPIPHLPPGMGGAHLAQFVLASGVPMPAGDPVHACIVLEDTQEQVGRTCSMLPHPAAIIPASRQH